MLYSISAILFFAFLVVAVYPYVFCFVLLDSIISQHVFGCSNEIMLSSYRVLCVMVVIDAVSSSSIEVVLISFEK